MVPHLITALTGPINELEQRILESLPAIERWFRLEWMEHTPPFYTSVDLRNAGFKLAPVDTNLFPGGFNNLNAGFPAALPCKPRCQRWRRSARKRKRLLAGPGEPYAQYLSTWRNVSPLVTNILQAGGHGMSASAASRRRSPRRRPCWICMTVNALQRGTAGAHPQGQSPGTRWISTVAPCYLTTILSGRRPGQVLAGPS